jgi:hypothetical protein
MIIPVVTADLDPGAIEQLITLCVQYDRIRGHARGDADGTAGTPDGRDPGSNVGTPQDGTPVPERGRPGQDAAGKTAQPAGTAAQVLAMLEHQILATVIQIVSGPGDIAAFLRRNLLGKGLNGPSLPLDVGQP